MFKHDCSDCHYLGTLNIKEEKNDFYYCKPQESFICRYGDKGEQYSSMPICILSSLTEEQRSEINEAPLIIGYFTLKHLF